MTTNIIDLTALNLYRRNKALIHPIEKTQDDFRIGDKVFFKHGDEMLSGFIISITRRAHLGFKDHYLVDNGIVRRPVVKEQIQIAAGNA